MNTKFLSKLLVLTSISWLGVTSLGTQAQNPKNSYKCLNNKGIPTTVVDTNRGRIQLITWRSDFFGSSGWTPQKRCQEVTKRFQQFSNSGKLRFVTTGIENNNPVICVGQQVPGKGYSCIRNGLLMTLQPNDNPNDVLKNLFSNAARVGGTPVSRDPSGKTIISMDQFLTTGVAEPIDENATEVIVPENETENEQENVTPQSKEDGTCPAAICKM